MSHVQLALPAPVTELIEAHSRLCRHFQETRLTFTLDGKLLGDIGEAIVSQVFGIKLCEKRTAGVDGHAPDGRSVQIKSTGRLRSGPAFTPGEGIADHLIFVRIDFVAGQANVLYNGPEAPVRRLLPAVWTGTKVVSLPGTLAADAQVEEQQRLRILS